MHSYKAKKRPLKNNLPLLKCECGHEILLLPDLKTLGKVIEEHAMEHKNKYSLTQEEAEAIQDNLIAQALRMASEITNSCEDPKKNKNPGD